MITEESRNFYGSHRRRLGLAVVCGCLYGFQGSFIRGREVEMEASACAEEDCQEGGLDNVECAAGV